VEEGPGLNGAVGKTGRVSTLLAIRVAQTEDASGATTYEASAPAAFIQINDLSGPAGAGRLNLKAGQGEVALPFIGCSQKLVSNSHLAETSIGIFDCEQRLVELNGSIVTLDEESMAPTHRYSIGITRQDVNNDDKFLGYYASYSLTFKEVYSLGLIYRGGEERSGPVDINFNKYGGAAEAELGPFILTAGYFRSDRSGLGDLENYIIEAFVIPMKRIGLGARYDTLREKGKKGASSRSLMLRYSILNNMYGQFEFRALSDDDLVAGSNEEETKLRLFLTALF
jgi:hypothetical protein